MGEKLYLCIVICFNSDIGTTNPSCRGGESILQPALYFYIKDPQD